MKTPVKISLLLGFCAILGILLWPWQSLVKQDKVVLPVAVHGEDTETTAKPEKAEPPVVEAEPREVVKTLCGKMGDGSAETRLAAAQALPNDLNMREYEMVLEDVLLAAQPEGIYYRAWHAVFNDTLNGLVRGQSVRLEALPGVLHDIIKDKDRHIVIRDYALQHILAYAEFRMGAGERLALIDSIWPVVKKEGHSLPGTYMLTLLHAPNRGGWPSKTETSERAWELLQDNQTHILSRITALQACGQLGDHRALPIALEVAADSKAHMSLRTAAIATIGNLGTAAEVGYLEKLNNKAPRRLQVALNAALQKLAQPKKTI